MDQQAPQLNILKAVKSMLPIGLMIGFNKLGIDSTDPVQLLTVRIVSGAMFLLYFAIIFFIQYKISTAQSNPKLQKVVRYVSKKSMSMQETIAAQQARAEGGEEPDTYEYKEQTFYEYDLEQLIKLRNSSLTSIAITIGIHLWLGYLQPIVIQSVMNNVRLFDHAATHIYLFGQEVSRPYPAEEASPLASLMGTKSETELMDEWDQAQKKKGERPAGVYDSKPANPQLKNAKESKKTK